MKVETIHEDDQQQQGGVIPQLRATECTTGPSRGLYTGEKIKMGTEWLK